MRQAPPPVFSRRSFIFFVLLAPACLLAVAAIVITLQYRQFQALVAPTPAIEAMEWREGDSARVSSLTASFAAFSADEGADTLRVTPDDLTLLASASPTVRKQDIRFRITATDTHLVVESTQRIDALGGRLAWIFKRIAPEGDRWLNARMIGLPEHKASGLDFAPERGFLNGARVPRAALTKRGGMSPKDFIDPKFEPEYRAFLAAVDKVLFEDGTTLLIRKR